MESHNHHFTGIPLSHDATPAVQQNLILCCSCGTAIPPNPANMCVNCVRNQVDISEGIPKQITAPWCRNCERYLQPPNSWIVAHPESRELMALILKKLKGLGKVRLIDASFIWTEPHSRRLKVKLTIQKEVFTSAILQQIFQVEIIVAPQQCPDCTRVMAQDTWKAVVQLRQKVSHKRTFFFLEQRILKHQVHRETVNIKECKDGLDFFFASKGHALNFLQFVQSAVPIKQTQSQQLISTDIKSGTANYKFTFSAEIIPLCRDDLIVLPLKLARQLGNINPLVLGLRVSGGAVTVIDPRTLQIADVQNVQYWRDPFFSLCDHSLIGHGGSVSEYYVLDVERLGESRGKYCLADVTVARCHRISHNITHLTEDDLEIDMDSTFITRTHLGYIIKEGDYCSGFDLQTSNFNSELFDELLNATRSSSVYHEVPDVVLVKKINFKSKKKSRHWKVKRIADGMEVEADEEVRRTLTKKGEQEKREIEWESFMRELEQDREMRGMVNLYKDGTAKVEPKEHEEEPDLAELLDDLEINDTAPPDHISSNVEHHDGMEF